MSPSAEERARRAAALPEGGDAAVAAAADATENLAVARVPVVDDGNDALAVAALRTTLTTKLPHHLEPAATPLVIAGPFGIGKRQLMQRMLTLYPHGFSMPPVYTTRAGAEGGQLRVVDAAFVEALKEKALVAFEETAVGERYVVSLEDIAECAFDATRCHRAARQSVACHSNHMHEEGSSVLVLQCAPGVC